jgi:hypothetical protein
LHRYTPVLAYSVETRLGPMFEYLAELGMDTEAIVENLTRRPNLLGRAAHSKLTH